MDTFYSHGKDGEKFVVWSPGGVVDLYEALIALAKRNPQLPYGAEVSYYLRERIETCYGFGAFSIELECPDSKPIEFWQCIAHLIAQLADEELGKEQPSDDLVNFIPWEDDVRCVWRKFLEDLYALIDHALPAQNKLPPLRSWVFKFKRQPYPPLGPDDFLCQECRNAYIRKNEDKCPVCGWTWKRKEEW